MSPGPLRRRWLSRAVALAAIAGSLGIVGASTPSSAPHDGVRGASLGLFASDPEYDYSAMLGEIADRGATDVLIVYRVMQSDPRAHDLRLISGHSPSLATLERTLDTARALGLRPGLMPIVGLATRDAGEWRGTLMPRAGVEVWFEHYRPHALAAARLAAAHGASRLIVGSELNRLEDHPARWRALIREVRERYRGRIAYSANWDRYEAVRFWDAVDEIAVSAYFPMNEGRPTAPQAGAHWHRHLATLERFAAERRRPLLLSEVGYPAHAEASAFPWDETRHARIDLALQAQLLGAFCRSYEQTPGAGYYVWNWFGRGGPRDHGYSLRGKPAAAEFEQCMSESERTPR